MRRAEGTLGAGGQRVDTCACGRQKLARSARCIACANVARAERLCQMNAERGARKPAPATPAPKPVAPPKSPSPRKSAPSPDRVTRLARALARDPRPDEDKVGDRLTLLKMIKRRRDRRREEAA